VSNTLKKGEDAEFYSGRAGVSFTDSRLSGVVRLSRPDDSSVGAENHPKFLYSLLNVSLTKSNGEKVKFVIGPVYVFFIVRASDVRAWESGEVDLYYFDSWHKKWTPCGAFLVKNGGERPRIACRIRVFGLYGLAERVADD
jgi:hypothetical protein